MGAKVKGFSLKPSKKLSLYNEIKGDSLCKSFIGDINDFDEVSVYKFQM